MPFGTINFPYYPGDDIDVPIGIQPVPNPTGPPVVERKTFREWSNWWTANLAARQDSVNFPAGLRFPTAAEVGVSETQMFSARELELIVEPWMETLVRGLVNNPVPPANSSNNGMLWIIAIVVGAMLLSKRR